MGDLQENIDAEFDNIGDVLDVLPAVDDLPGLSQLELAGVSTLLHNFYNGVENVMKHSLSTKATELPAGPNWHRDLLRLACSKGLITRKTMEALGPYLAFRHFASHGYAIDLDPHKLSVLVENVRSTCGHFKADITAATR